MGPVLDPGGTRLGPLGVDLDTSVAIVAALNRSAPHAESHGVWLKGRAGER